MLPLKKMISQFEFVFYLISEYIRRAQIRHAARPITLAALGFITSSMRNSTEQKAEMPKSILFLRIFVSFLLFLFFLLLISILLY